MTRPTVFTTVMYPMNTEVQKEQSSVRRPLFVETLQTAVTNGVNVVVLDGGFWDAWLTQEAQSIRWEGSILWVPEWDALSDLVKAWNSDDISRFTKNGEGKMFGLGPGRRYIGNLAWEAFPDSSFFAWSEPEKDIWVQQTIHSIMSELQKAHILVWKRDPAWMEKSYPAQQVEVESRASQTFHAMIIEAARQNIWDRVDELIWKDPLDHWSGPHAFVPEALKQVFLQYKGQGWDSIITILYPALMRWFAVWEFQMHTLSGAPWTYPKSQLELESSDPETYERLRLSQEATILAATEGEIVRMKSA